MTLLTKDGTPAAPSTPPRVGIAIACQDMVHASFARCLASLVGTTMASVPGIQLGIQMVKGTLLPDSRNDLVRKALEREWTHILWLDSDMVFPKDALLRLLAHDAAIVGCNYPTRRTPIKPTAELAEGGLLVQAPDASGLVPVRRMGFGVVLTRTDVFTPALEPWFSLAYMKQIGEHVGEDVWFCRRAALAGFQPQVDLGLSNEVTHLGEFEYDSDVLRAATAGAMEAPESADGPRDEQ